MKKKSLHSMFVLLLAVLFFLPNIQSAMAGDLDYSENKSTSQKQRLTLTERLLLENAVCALWHNSMKQNSVPVDNLDPFTLTAPENIFLEVNYFGNDKDIDIWFIDGVIRQMGVQADGIEYISGINFFNVQFKRQADGSFRIHSVLFEPVGRG